MWLNPGVTATEKPLKEADFLHSPEREWIECQKGKWIKDIRNFLFPFYSRIISLAYREEVVIWTNFAKYLNYYLTWHSYTEAREKAGLDHTLIKQVWGWWEICTQFGNQSVPNRESNLPRVQKFVYSALFSPPVNDVNDRTKSKLIKFTADTNLEGL